MKDFFLDFLFFRDLKIIIYIKLFKIVFIMRGVFGFGKFIIVRVIQKVYFFVVLCSVDNYFMREGEYYFSVDDLESVYKYCQRFVEEVVRKDSNVIIIDNINVKCWEMKFYMDLVRQYFYCIVIVEFKLDWRNNFSFLVFWNIYDVDENII